MINEELSKNNDSQIVEIEEPIYNKQPQVQFKSEMRKSDEKRIRDTIDNDINPSSSVKENHRNVQVTN